MAITREVGSVPIEIGSTANEMNDLVAGIARASADQAQAIERINDTVEQVDTITQANAASAEQTAAASEQLSGQVAATAGMVSRLSAMIDGATDRPGHNGRRLASGALVHPTVASSASHRTPLAQRAHRVIAFDEDEANLVATDRDLVDV